MKYKGLAVFVLLTIATMWLVYKVPVLRNLVMGAPTPA